MVFALIFAIVLISFIVVFGYDAITRMFCIGKDSQVQKAFDSVKEYVNRLYMKAKGSSDIAEVNIPSGSRICFVNSTSPGRNSAGQWYPDRSIEEIITVEGYNTWIEFCRGSEGYTLRHVRIDENFCVIGPSRIYLENKGAYVSIERM